MRIAVAFYVGDFHPEAPEFPPTSRDANVIVSG